MKKKLLGLFSVLTVVFALHTYNAASAQVITPGPGGGSYYTCYCNIGGYCTTSGSGYQCGAVYGGNPNQCGLASGNCPSL